MLKISEYALKLYRPPVGISLTARRLTIGPDRLVTDQDHKDAARWLGQFRQDGSIRIPKTAYDIQMTRSSGPGGQVSLNRLERISRLLSVILSLQNVNKLSTKAMLRMDVPPRPDAAGNKWLPDFALAPLRGSVSPLYAQSHLFLTAEP